MARLETFTCQDATSAAFLTWRAQMLDALIVLQGENALCVFEWRVLRFVPASAPDEAHARLLLRSVKEKQAKG